MDEPETEAIDLDYRPLTYFDSLVQPIQPVVFVVAEEDSAQERAEDSAEYWASPWDDAVEIAQIHIRTIHWDIVAVYALPGDGCVYYRITDDYEGATLDGDGLLTAEQPLSLGELVEYITSTWPFFEVTYDNCQGNLVEMLKFFTGGSDFYEDFDAVLREQVRTETAAVEARAAGKR